jgi:hypothetical protein
MMSDMSLNPPPIGETPLVAEPVGVPAVRESLGSLSETAATVLALLLTIAIMTGFALVLDLLFTISIAQ